ncbi:MAG: moaE [candidate division NC10 bacterium]|jgi:molybdopterin/thiamine biosynthesis adenylyltransferase|nr:moaE [candidate division NC10 bacterium]
MSSAFELAGKEPGRAVSRPDNVHAARYQRNLGTLGVAGQGRLLASHALVVGLGGLGGYVVEQLARSGVGRITGVDPDRFEETNLNRQLLATLDTLGSRKVDAAQKRIASVNPACVFTGVMGRHRDISQAVWSTVDIGFDCLDSIADRLDLADICARNACILIHGAVAGWYAQVAVVWPGQPTLKSLYPSTGPGWEQEIGTPPFTVGLAASLMVAQGVKIMIGESIARSPRVEFIDLRESHWLTTSL